MASLAKYATEVEVVCQEIDNAEGTIPTDLINRFAFAQGELATKVDNFIGFLDAVKARVTTLKEHRDRVVKAIRTAESFERGLKDYVKFVMLANPGMQFKGEEGSFRLQRNPPSLKIDFAREDKTIHAVVDPALIHLEPSLAKYVKAVSCFVIDTERLKEALEAGEEIPWARIEKDNKHVRIGG